MKLKAKIAVLIFLIFLGWIVVLQTQNFSYPKAKEIQQRINFLHRVINQPLEHGYEIMQLGYESHEFMLFSYAFSSYAMTNLTIKDNSYKRQAINMIKESISKVFWISHISDSRS